MGSRITIMAAGLESTDVKNKLEDLSGVVLKPGENPYNALIEACHDDPVSSPAMAVQEHRDYTRT